MEGGEGEAGSSVEAGGGDWSGIFFFELSACLLFHSLLFSLLMASSPVLPRPTAGTAAAAATAFTSHRATSAVPRRHSRRTLVAKAKAPGDDNNDEQADEQAKKARKAISPAASAAAASLLAAASAQPVAAFEHPQEGGWRHSLRPRRHLRAMGDFERDRLLRVRLLKKRKKMSRVVLGLLLSQSHLTASSTNQPNKKHP